MFQNLEKRLKIVLFQIEFKKITTADSGIGKMLNQMKKIDEPCYNKMLEEYKGILNKIKA